MKAVALTTIKAIAKYHVIYVDEDSPLAEDYCFS